MTRESPLVSIILPTFNRADVISRAIESVINQTYSNYELIIVDDGSSDNTSAIVSKYTSGVKYIKQLNSGVSSARNTGIRSSSGKYIAFIDSDDAWHAEKLELQIKFFQDHSQSNIAIVCTDANFIDMNGNEFVRIRKLQRKSTCVLDFMTLLKDPYLGLPTVMLDAGCVSRDNVFDESLKTAEDIDLYLRLGSKYSIGYIHNKLVNVHTSRDSLSSSTQSYEDNILVLERCYATCPKAEYIKQYNATIHSVYLDYAKYLLWRGNIAQCRKALVNAIKYRFTLFAAYYFIKSFLKTSK